jgi:hypothetical protein
MLKRLASVAAALLIGALTLTPSASKATDLKVESINLNYMVLMQQSILIQFLLINQNILAAEVYNYRARIWRKGQTSPVYDKTESGEPIQPFTERTISFAEKWNPLQAGEYEIEVNVNFSEDIDNSNNTLRQSFTLVEKPPIDLNIQQVVKFEPTKEEMTTHGIVRMAIPPTATVKFLNILVRRNAESEGKWMVRNVMVLPSDRTQDVPLHTWINFSELGYTQGEVVDSIVACVSITDTPRTVPPAPDVTCSYVKVSPTAYNVSPVILDEALQDGPQFFTPEEYPTFFKSLPTVTDSVERGCTMSNLDLDSTQHNPVTEPGYAGDWNACGPVATANSMQWLEDSNPAIKTNTTLREKLRELSSMMGRRARDNGVGTRQMLRGKLAFIDKYKLPIRVKYQSMFDTFAIASPSGSGHSADNQSAKGPSRLTWAPKWEWVVKEMQDSEDVEIMVGWYRDTGRTGGHWVTLTGTHTIHGVKRFRIKDDGEQAAPGGTSMTVLTWDTSSLGWPIVKEWGDSTKTCFIESALSESYDTTVKHEPVKSVDERSSRPIAVSATVAKDRRVKVSIDLGEEAAYFLRVVDINGKTVDWLVEDKPINGSDEVTWDARGEPAGVYFIVATGKDRRGIAKIVLE